MTSEVSGKNPSPFLAWDSQGFATSGIVYSFHYTRIMPQVADWHPIELLDDIEAGSCLSNKVRLCAKLRGFRGQGLQGSLVSDL